MVKVRDRMIDQQGVIGRKQKSKGRGTPLRTLNPQIARLGKSEEKKELTAFEERHVGLETVFAETLLKTPVVEDLRHVGGNPVSTTPALLRRKSQSPQRRAEKRKTDVEEVGVLF